MPPTYPHVVSTNPDPADVDVPDPQFGALDAAVLTSLLGEPALQAARWASYAKEQQTCIAALRAQVAALKAKVAAATPEPVAAKSAAKD